MKIIKSRLFKILALLFIVGFFLGIISYFIIGNKNNSINSYFDLINNNNLNYLKFFINSISNNYKYAFLIWIFGFIFFLTPIIPFIIVFRGIRAGFTILSIISSFKLKGFLYGLILAKPVVLINEVILMLISYYAINISFKIINIFKNNKSINIKLFFKNYFYQLIIFLGLLLLSSLFETYITSNIIKFML